MTQAMTQNTASASASTATGERAMAPASMQRAESAGPAAANSPTAAGAFGLTQAAARAPTFLPAQARPASAPSLPANQVAVHIQRAVAAGQSRITISLHPAELGQIDVKLNIGNDGAVKAIVSVERPETFEMLQRDARGLEKALQDAGLKTDSGSLSFNLKGQSERDTAAGGNGPENRSPDAENDSPAEPELAPDAIAAANTGGADRVLDLHV
jgi:flagellar hook-length control protein FliK